MLRGRPSTMLNLYYNTGVSLQGWVCDAGKNEECVTELEVSEMKRLSSTTLLNDHWLRVPLPW